jgi:hypothetical protein
MTSRQFVEFSDASSWGGRTAVSEDSAQQPHVAPPLVFNAKSQQGAALDLRLGLYALAFLLGSAFLFIFPGFCVTADLADAVKVSVVTIFTKRTHNPRRDEHFAR